MLTARGPGCEHEYRRQEAPDGGDRGWVGAEINTEFCHLIGESHESRNGAIFKFRIKYRKHS